MILQVTAFLISMPTALRWISTLDALVALAVVIAACWVFYGLRRVFRSIEARWYMRRWNRDHALIGTWPVHVDPPEACHDLPEHGAVAAAVHLRSAFEELEREEADEDLDPHEAMERFREAAEEYDEETAAERKADVWDARSRSVARILPGRDLVLEPPEPGPPVRTEHGRE